MAFIGSCSPYLAHPDRVAGEVVLEGDFKAGLAEFEGATPASPFVRRGAKATPAWSGRFERGFSPVLDGLWKSGGVEGTRASAVRSGPTASYEGLLVIGRSGGLGPREQARLRWRRERVVADSKHVYCVTYDGLDEHPDAKLRLYGAASELEGEP